MSHGTPSVTSPISLQELAWQHGLTATQETPIPVQRLHVADTGGVTPACCSPAPQLRDHPWRQISFSQVIYPAPLQPCLFHGCLQRPGALQRNPSPHVAGSWHTSLSGYPHLPSFPPSKEAAHMEPSPRSEGSRCGVLGKGQMDLASIQETAAAFLFLPSSAYHNSIPGKDHFGSPAPP